MGAVTPSRLDFSTDFRYERVFRKSSVAFSAAGFSFPTFTIPHGLNYNPYVRLWISFDATGKIYPIFSGPGSYNIDGNFFQIDDVYTDATNITISVENNAAGTITGRIYYRVYEEQTL